MIEDKYIEIKIHFAFMNITLFKSWFLNVWKNLYL